MRNIHRTALGPAARRRHGIKYRERSPLVLPNGSTNCRRRRRTTSAAKDAGLAGRSRTSSGPRSSRRPSARSRRLNRRKRSRPLRPSQLQSPGAAAPRPRPDSGPGRHSNIRRPELATPNWAPRTSISSIWASKEEYVAFTGEPPRSSLTEPPAGYRTPSPAQPYGVGQKNGRRRDHRSQWTRSKCRHAVQPARREDAASRACCRICRAARALRRPTVQRESSIAKARETHSSNRLMPSSAAMTVAGLPLAAALPPCNAAAAAPRSPTSSSPTGSSWWWCRTIARRSSPTWSGTRSAPPTRRRASPASPISSNI